MKLNFRRFVAILLVAMMTLTALPTAGIAEVMQDVSRESGSIRMLMVEPDDETYYTYEFYDEDGMTLIASQIVKNGDTLLEPAAPAKANKKFDRWNSHSQVNFGLVSGLTGENRTIKVTAEYTEVYYVFFVDNNGRVVKTKEAANGEPVNTADVLFPVEADQAITGWYADAAFNTPVTTVTIHKANVTLYAKVEAGHWLTFDSKGGSYVAPVFVPNGKTAEKPADPTRPGYTFDGWDFDFNTVLTVGATATANWKVNPRTRYTVIHWQENADDEEYSYVESETRYGATGAKTTAAAKSYTGFTAQTITQQTIAGDGSTIVNVYYKRNEYFVKFYDRWGSSEYTEHRIAAKYGANIRKQWPGGGWYVSSNGSTAQTNIDVMPLNGKNFYGKQDGYIKSTASYYTEVLPGEESSGTRMPNGKYYKLNHQDTTNSNGKLSVTDEDRYPMTGFTVNTGLSTKNGSNYNGAKFYYDRAEYKVIYINNTEKEAPYKYQQDISDAGNYTLPNTDAPAGKEGYIFDGWAADADGKVPYDFTGKTMPAQNITVYAKWKAPTYTVTFFDHYKVQYGEVATVNKGDTVAKPEYAVPLSSEAEQFLGWVLKDETPFNFETQINRDYELHAKVASTAAYSVIYDANGGTGDVPVDPQMYAKDALADVKPDKGLTPPQGKDFLGWSTNPDATTAEVYPYGKLTIGTENVILYAIWGVRENTVAITYNGNGGALTDGKTEYTIPNLSNNGKIEVAENTFAKAGYNFVQWNTSDDRTGTAFQPGDNVRVNGEGANVLYAIWEAAEQNYTVEFYYENADGTYDKKRTETRQGKTDDTVSVTDDDKRQTNGTQYVFDVENGNNELSGEIPATGTLVLKLYFKLNTAQYTIHHYLKDTEIPVAENQTGTMQIGQTLTATAATNLWIEDLNAVEPFGSITINADPTQNVINVYYTKDVTFTGESKTVAYTGDEQEITGIKVEGLLDGDTWTGLSYSAKGTNVGKYTGTFTGKQKIMRAGKEATYYNVTKTEGMLTITANAAEVTVTITGNTGTEVYNGSEQSVTGYTTDVGDKTITVALKEGSKAEAKGTNAGKYYMGLTKDDFTVTSANYSNIKVVVVDGYLEIEPVMTAITITAASGSKKYDGTPLTDAGYTYTPNVLLEGDELTAVVEGSATDVGDEGKNVVKSYKVMRGNVDVTGNYTFTDSVDGKLTITPREVTLTSETASKEYDGTPLTRPVVTVGGDGFVAGEVSDIKATGNVTYVGDGTVDNTITYTTSESFKDANYTISETVGKLSITKRSEVIVITTASRTRAYNGNKLLDNQTTHTGTLAEGDQLIVNFSADAGLTDVGSKANAYASYAVKRDGRDVTDNYTFGEPEIGTLRVTPVEIELTAASDSKTYDGTPLTNGNYTITKGSFVGEEGLAGVTVEGSQTTVGSSANTITGHTLKENTKDENYDITYKPGTLTVTQNTETIIITANSHTWEYDGQPHTDGGYTVNYEGKDYTAAAGESVVLPTGDTLTATVEGTVTNVADSANNNNIVTDVTIVNGNGDSVRDQYATITRFPGGLKITRRGAGEQKVVLTAADNTVVYDGQAHGAKLNDAGEIAVNTSYTITYLAEGHSVQTVTITGSQTNVGKYPRELVPSGAIIVDGDGKDVTANYLVTYKEGDLEITSPETVIVEIQGNQKTFTYNANPHGVYGYMVLSISNRAYTAEDFGMVEGASAYAEGTNVGKYDMKLTAESFKNLNENFESVQFVVTDGWLEITPITEEVTVNITGNHDSKVYNGSEQSVTGYTTDVGEKTINVTLNETGKDTAKGTNANTYPMGLTEADFTVTSANYSNIKVVVVDGYLEIKPVTDKVTVTIKGHKDTFKYDGMEHTVTGYDVTGISNALYTEADFTFSGTAEVKEKNASELPYPMGLNASQFTNVSRNFSNVEFVVTDGQLTINPRNITIRANNVTVEYDGKPHGENGYTLDGDGLAEGETILGLVIDGEQTEADFYPGELRPHDARIGAEGSKEIYPDNYKIEYANGNLEITPVAAEVVVTITEHGGKAKYDGTEHVVTGYDVTSISNPLYTADDFVFNGKDEVKGIDAGSYPMLLKSADFVNTSKNFDKVTFVIVDATLEIEKREVTLTSASDEKVYDGKALTNDEVTASGDGFAEDEGAYCDVTGRQLNVGESDNEFTYELLRGTKAGNYKITKEYGTLKVTPVTEEVVVTITGHKGSAKYDGSEKTVTGYDVTGISNPLYTENDFTFSGDATASGIHAGKYPMGLKAEDFKNTSENFANVKFVVEDGEMEIQKIALTITSESYEGDYDAQWHQVGYTAEGLAATDAITALEMKNHRILKPGEMVSEFVANTLKITHADGSDATGDYEVTFVPGKLTVNTVIVNYRVFYYYDGVLDESEIEEGTGEVLTQITEYKDKPKDMQFDHVTGFPLTLGLDEMKNIIRVYYVHTPLTGNLGAANIGDCIE